MEDAMAECTKLLQEGVLYCMQGSKLGINPIFRIEGTVKFVLKSGSKIRCPQTEQRKTIRERFEKIKIDQSEREGIVILLEDVEFTSVTDAAYFVFGQSPAGNGYHWWNLKQEKLKSTDVYNKITTLSTIQSLPRIFHSLSNQVCVSCFISFINDIPKYCKTEQEIVRQTIEFMKLHQDYFEVYRESKQYIKLKDGSTYQSLLVTLKKLFLNEKMYHTFVAVNDVKSQDSFLTTLYQLQEEPVYLTVKYIYDEFCELEKEKEREKTRITSTSIIHGLLDWFKKPDNIEKNGYLKQKDE